MQNLNERWLRAAGRLMTILVFAAALAGCDKCGDYFWIDGATPHSCKESPAPH